MDLGNQFFNLIRREDEAISETFDGSQFRRKYISAKATH